MNKFLVMLLAGLIVSPCGVTGCSAAKDKKADKPAATEKADDKKAKDAEAAKEEAPVSAEKDTAKSEKAEASLKTFGADFCKGIKENPNSFSQFLALRPLMRMGLELEFSKDPESQELVKAMDMEKLVDMGIKQSGIEQMEFPMMNDIGSCDTEQDKMLACEEIGKILNTKGMMGEDLIPEEVTKKVLDAYKITECGSIALKGDDGVINLGLLFVEDAWKIITIWD
jgi:hypothetical protein